jgi:voltage-gated potassium channel Kch
MEAKPEEDSVLKEMLIIDFNPQVLEELKRRGIRCLYGDIASMETLHHASISRARLVVCTLTDSVLKGTSNLRMLKQLRAYCPAAGLVMASDTIAGSLELYEAGADFVFIPRMHSAHRMAEVLRTALEDGLAVLRREEIAALRSRDEVLA